MRSLLRRERSKAMFGSFRVEVKPDEDSDVVEGFDDIVVDLQEKCVTANLRICPHLTTTQNDSSRSQQSIT